MCFKFIDIRRARPAIAWIAIATLILLSGCRPESPNGSGPSRRGDGETIAKSAGDAEASENLSLGNPSNASAEPVNRDNFLVIRDAFAASYNASRGTANWVSWRVSADDLGKALPRAAFRPDTELPPTFRRVLPTDYSGSGFDRGHLVPSADRFANPIQNEETFMMTNIVPQARDLNQYPWQKLEAYTRSIVRRGYDVYAFAGVAGTVRTLKNRVTVPASCWKILYIVPRGREPISSSKDARVIAVDMPNIEGIAGRRWRQYKTTVRKLEQKLGYNFFSVLPRSEQDRIENAIDKTTLVSRRLR